MPTYEYRCDSCTHQFEVFARMSDPDPEVCEACGASTLSKVLFPVAVHYKGSGFYNTDYGTKKTAASADSSGATGESSSTDTSSGSSDSGSSTSDSSGSTTPKSPPANSSSGTTSGSSNDG